MKLPKWLRVVFLFLFVMTAPAWLPSWITASVLGIGFVAAVALPVVVGVLIFWRVHEKKQDIQKQQQQ